MEIQAESHLNLCSVNNFIFYDNNIYQKLRIMF